MGTWVRTSKRRLCLAHSTSRREFLVRAGGGCGKLALAAMLAAEAHSARAGETQPLSARVKRIIWLFMHGGPSHVDLFDPKPELIKLAGQPIPASFGEVMTRRKVAANPLLGPIKPFRARGQSGIQISDFLPRIAEHADELCVIRSLHGDSVNHPQSVYQMNTGSILMGHPSVGSWVSYGLGSENADLPGFVVLPDPGGGLKGGPPAWGSGYLPARHQGVPMRAGSNPILHLQPTAKFTPAQQRGALDMVQELNRQHLELRSGDDQLEARIKAYELAYRMQAAAPDLVDMRDETASTLDMYGLSRPATSGFAQRCLMARRMIERGVRFVQVYSGDTNGWDAHNDVLKNHAQLCEATDQPIAALLTDLKQRGLWDETLVIWGGEFGRMPMSESGTGRDHNPWGYSIWLAGGAVKGGHVHGATDAVGLRALDSPVHIRDLHATLLHLLGLNPFELSYYHNGLNERLIGPTDEVKIVREVLA